VTSFKKIVSVITWFALKNRAVSSITACRWMRGNTVWKRHVDTKPTHRRTVKAWGTSFCGPETTKCDQLSAWNEATSNDLCGSPVNYCYLSYLSYYTFDYDNRIKSYSCVHLWILSPTYRDKNGPGSNNFSRPFNSYWILSSILYGVYGTLNESLNENFSGGMATCATCASSI
jgi:hypothetical protein